MERYFIRRLKLRKWAKTTLFVSAILIIATAFVMFAADRFNNIENNENAFNNTSVKIEK